MTTATETAADDAGLFPDESIDAQALEADAIETHLLNHTPGVIGPGGLPVHFDGEAVLQEADAKAMTASFVILTRQAGVNMHGNKHHIQPNKWGQGMRTEQHERSPIVLFQHGYVLPYPIGVSEVGGKYSVKAQKTKATATVSFSQAYPEASLIFAMVDEGIFRMSSVGFRGLKALHIEPAQQKLPDGVENLAWWEKYGGLDFVETLLMEWSIVDTGADQGALRQLLDRGQLHGARLTQSLRPWVKQAIGEVPVVVPGATFGGQKLTVEKKTVDTPAEIPKTPADDDAPLITLDDLLQAVTAKTPKREEPTITAEQLFAAIGQRVEQTIASAVEAKIKPVADAVEALNADLNRRLGKVD